MFSFFQSPARFAFASFSAARAILISNKLNTLGFLLPPVKDLQNPFFNKYCAKFCSDFSICKNISPVKFPVPSMSNIFNFTSLLRHRRSVLALPILNNSGSFVLLGI